MKNLICICCPKGCHLTVDEEHGYEVTGYGCKRGLDYGKAEATNPTRTITSVVRILGAGLPVCPVKTSGPVPKDKIMQVMEEIKRVSLTSPVCIGDVVAKDICHTGCDLVVTREM